MVENKVNVPEVRQIEFAATLSRTPAEHPLTLCPV